MATSAALVYPPAVLDLYSKVLMPTSSSLFFGFPPAVLLITSNEAGLGIRSLVFPANRSFFVSKRA